MLTWTKEDERMARGKTRAKLNAINVTGIGPKGQIMRVNSNNKETQKMVKIDERADPEANSSSWEAHKRSWKKENKELVEEKQA